MQRLPKLILCLILILVALGFLLVAFPYLASSSAKLNPDEFSIEPSEAPQQLSSPNANVPSAHTPPNAPDVEAPQTENKRDTPLPSANSRNKSIPQGNISQNPVDEDPDSQLQEELPEHVMHGGPYRAGGLVGSLWGLEYPIVKKRVNVLMTVWAEPTPSSWLYPKGKIPCPQVDCILYYNSTPPYGITNEHARHLPEADIVTYYVDMNYSNAFFETVKSNPQGKALMMINNENILRSHLDSLFRNWWLGKLVTEPEWWNKFNITHTLERGSTIPWSPWQHSIANPDVESYLRANRPVKYEAKHKNVLGIFVSSHPGHSFNRFGYIRRLSRFIPVHHFSRQRTLGDFFRRKGGAPNVTKPNTVAECGVDAFLMSQALCYMRRYFYSYTFENSLNEDYVTEKLYNGLLAGAVPVYKGAPNVNDFVPKRSLILIDDFEKEEDLGYYLECVARNQTLYDFYRRFHTRPTATWLKVREAPHPLCQACQLVARNHPILQNMSRIPKPVAGLINPRHKCNQRPFGQCLRPGTSLPGYYSSCTEPSAWGGEP